MVTTNRVQDASNRFARVETSSMTRTHVGRLPSASQDPPAVPAEVSNIEEILAAGKVEGRTLTHRALHQLFTWDARPQHQRDAETSRGKYSHQTLPRVGAREPPYYASSHSATRKDPLGPSANHEHHPRGRCRNRTRAQANLGCQFAPTQYHRTPWPA